MEELWTRYGSLFEIWFDGGVAAEEEGGAKVAELLEKYQKSAICFQGPKEHAQNLRWIGNEDGIAPVDTWSTSDQCVCHFDGSRRDSEIGAGVPSGRYWFPAETDMGNRKSEAAGCGWGWAPGQEHLLWKPEELLERYYTSVGRNSNFLLGQCIADDGRFMDTEQFEAFGRLVDEIYRNPLASTKGEGMRFSLKLPENSRPRHVSVMENIAEGERIRKFRIMACTKEGERELLSARCIGHKRLIPIEPLHSSEIRLDILESEGRPQIRDFTVYA